VGTHQISGSNLSVAAGSSLTIDNWSIINLASNTAKASVRHPVHRLRGRRPTGEGGHRPASAQQPVAGGDPVGVRRDRVQALHGRRALRQVAAESFDPAQDDMDEGVDETRRDQAAGAVHLGRSGGTLAQLRCGPDAEDAIAVEQHAAPTPVGVAVEDRTTGQQQTHGAVPTTSLRAADH
jgi:hypothetical protein